ncbi:16S rRNA (cytosine(1402)-N(4))-methyltransferase RsmH [Spirulina sp. CS-785/01]|uniref:16S rRNA (cytosine(1402)-N(4))-methyltransferase RsmH n=1 Tax=Spirulina sp. CS-785/01 TaxID=3021716 RepID=UPI00232FB322|nr:16S rRNA (cytosine(1402)-N(4))-methyltransferase RsmH [Spirulina sp. CS-785/01]MDB9312474.1 16S rRNA (cytosine(1402)-N(4))-methyltransferase RsmH [Spirulina sp. CS-785/01]
MPFQHIPVLAQDAIAGLQIQPGGHYLDATVGGGGHSALILQAAPNVKLTVIDRDEEAILAAKTKLGDRISVWQGNFADYTTQNPQFDGILADLGVSSPQFDQPERGFSFQSEAPLDMRMDRSQPLTAADIINHWDAKDLADLFYHYGEERRSRPIARRILEKRPLHTTTQLADLIKSTFPPKARYGRIHPATRVFQALRIAVNGELTALETFLDKAPHWLKIGGRLGIISFHSLEDRRVKHHFRNCPHLQVITKKPITATAEEQQANPRSRSAKLRFAQRISATPD